MGASKTQITNLLEMRFDYQSARNILNNWRKQAGIKEDSNDLDDAQLKSLLEYLEINAPDAGRVHAGIERLILAKDAKHAEDHVQMHVEETHEEPAVEAALEAPLEEAAIEEISAEESPAEESPAEEAAVTEDAEESHADGRDNGKKSRKKGKH